MSVGRHLVARFYDDDIADDDVAAGNLLHAAVAQHLDGLFLAQLRQHVEAACGIALKVEAHGGGQYDGGYDADGLDEVVLHESQHQRHRGGHEEYAHHRVLILLEIEPPHRLSAGRRQHVFAVLPSACKHLVGSQSCSFFHNCVQNYKKSE